MGWTSWRKIAAGDLWFDEHFDYNGSACYELAIGGPRGGDMTIVYVGETLNEKSRVSRYARSGSHLSKIIDWHLRQGWHLYYRGTALDSKKYAKIMQDNLLRKFEYIWNTQMPNNDP